MTDMPKLHSSTPPIIATAVLVLVPLTYVGSYAALVTPMRIEYIPDRCGPVEVLHNYRLAEERAQQIFYPLEQLDRKLRPNTWAY